MKTIEVPFLWQFILFLVAVYLFQGSWNGGVASVFTRIPKIDYGQAMCFLVSLCILLKLASVTISGFFVTITDVPVTPSSEEKNDDNDDDTNFPQQPA
jgi:hypothetical protein